MPASACFGSRDSFPFQLPMLPAVATKLVARTFGLNFGLTSLGSSSVVGVWLCGGGGVYS